MELSKTNTLGFRIMQRLFDDTEDTYCPATNDGNIYIYIYIQYSDIEKP